MNIYPSYKCNMNCAFCALCRLPGELINLGWLKGELLSHPDLCEDINILGGEPSILPISYQEELISICSEAAGEKPFYITNLLKVSPALKDTRPIVSYDWGLRPSHQRVLTNMLNMDMPFAMSTILSDKLVDAGPSRFIAMIDRLPALERADLVLYRGGLTETDNSPHHNALLDFVVAVMDHPKVNLTPYSAMQGRTDNSFSNTAGRLGFLPDNKYGVRIDYAHLGYTPFDSYDEAVAYYHSRIAHISNTEPCRSCKFLGRCWCVGGFEDGVCHGDKEMMEVFDEHVHAARK